MYLMQTVSTVPRARPSTVRRSRSMDRNGPACAELPDNARGREFPLPVGQQYPPPSRRRTPLEHTPMPDPAEKKKEKKWSLGGFFRRRKKEADSDSSSNEEDDAQPRKGFLARRRSRREKRKQRTKIVGTFDHVVVNPLSQSNKQVRAPDVNGIGVPPPSDAAAAGRGGAIAGRGSRDSLGGSVDRLSSRSSRESLPQQHRRQDSSLSRNSSGSGSLEGSGSRRGMRGMVMARVEALRDQRGGSSSDECDGFPHSPSLARFRSDDSLNPAQRDGSFSRRSRLARTERYIKRLSRDEEGILKREAELDQQQRQRMCKSDAEGSFNRTNRNVGKGTSGTNNRWAATVLYQESSDMEPRVLTRTPSATPSPAQSPQVRQKPILQYTSSVPPCDSLTSTFPPSHNHYHGPVVSKSPPQNSSMRMPIGPRPYSTRGLSPAPSNRSNESLPTHGPPRGRTEYFPNRQNLNYENVYNKGGTNHGFELHHPGQRSHSYDSNIHHATNFGNNINGPSAITGTDDVMVVQFPIARPQRPVENSMGRGSSASPSLFKQGPPPPPPRDPQRRLSSATSQPDPPRPMSYAFESGSQPMARLEYSQSQPSRPVDHNGNVKTFSFVPQPHVFTNTPSASSVWPGYQRRSSSDNQIAAQFLQQTLQVRAQVANVRPRPSSVTPEAMRPLTQQYNSGKIMSRTPPDVSHKQQPSAHQFQYFADQQPRSRKPIHIQCNSSSVSDQPYLSDSQVVMMKPPYQDRRNPILHATEFWRQKEQEGVVKQRKPASTKPPLQHTARSDRSRSNSPRPKEHIFPENVRSRSSKTRVTTLTFPVRNTDSMSSLSGQSDISSPLQQSKVYSDGSCYDSYDSSGAGPHPMDSLRKKDSNNVRPLSMVLENTESQEQTSSSSVNESILKSLSGPLQSPKVPTKPVPPTPPARRYSRQSSTSSLEAMDWMGDDIASDESNKNKRRSSNLEDALNELEAIYKSLRLGDEDLLDRAERRDLPTAHQQHSHASLSASRGAESDSGFNYSYESVFDIDPPIRRQRAPSIRRSGIPDKVMDDMAYRRLHPKERPGSQDIRSVVSQSGSYILASPALSQSPGPDSSQQKSSSSITEEPDITFDDVVYRNIKHANNTLKIMDPQPPFGIPLGPITPAANSDYLHATPVERYRSTFKPRKVPDIVKDDLAFRNLRKDNQKDSSGLPAKTMDEIGGFLGTANPTRSENSNFSLRKKRAVRSLSANLMSFVHKEPLSIAVDNNEQEFEKAQSLSDLPDALQVAQKILEGKEVIGGGSVKLRNLTASTMDGNKHRSDSESTTDAALLDPRYGVTPSRWIERANLDKSLCGGTSTSTETLTDSRANLQQDGANKRSSWQQRLRVYIPAQGDAAPERKKSLGSPLDEGQLEELLTALAREARATSDRLDMELRQLRDETPNLRVLADKQKTVDDNQNDIFKCNMNPVTTIKENIATERSISEKNLKPEDSGNITVSASIHVAENTRKDSAESNHKTSISAILKPVPDDGHKAGVDAIDSQKTDTSQRSVSECKPETDMDKVEENVDSIDLEEQQPATICRHIQQLTINLCNESVEPVITVSQSVITDVKLEQPNTQSDVTGEQDEKCEKQVATIATQTSEKEEPVASGRVQEEEEATSSKHEDSVSAPSVPLLASTEGGDGAEVQASVGSCSTLLLQHQVDLAPAAELSNMSDRRLALASRTAPGDTTSGSSDGGSAETRMARYKEERRRQLASQFGARDVEVPPPRRYITRSGSGVATVSLRSSDTEQSSGGGAMRVRTTRASRLRAAASSPDASTKDVKPRRSVPLSDAVGRRLATSSTGTASSDKEKSSLSSSDAVSSRHEKDKSSKRKSNLNRSLAAEDVAVVDLLEDSAIRRRRRRQEPSNGLGLLETGRGQARPAEPARKNSNNAASASASDPPARRAPERTSRISKRISTAEAAAKPKPPANSSIQSSMDKTEEASRKVDVLTSITRETVTRLDKLASTPPVIPASQSKNKVNTSRPAEISEPLNHSLLRDSVEKQKGTLPEGIKKAAKDVASSATAEPVKTSSPSRQPSSILKKKSLEEPVVVVLPAVHPVSILKRKTSQDEASSGVAAPPVTFSPSVKEQSCSNSRRQGILKKRASLDESEVLRRRSCSPDMSHFAGGESASDFKPILKYQRRSSMEELVRRTQSPDPQPQSILKRRTSREDELDERSTSSPEPQGILKRKSNVSSSSSSNSTSPHVSISASVMMTVTAMESEFVSESTEQVRPILKKKSSSEDNTTADSSYAETPRPILKKKTSIDVEDMEDRPKKTILKTSKKHLREDIGGSSTWENGVRESPTRCLKLRSRSVGASDSTSGSDCEVVRPILKHNTEDWRSRERSASPRSQLSFCDDEPVKEKAGSALGSRNNSPSRETVILRRHSKSLVGSPKPETAVVESELSISRRSLEFSPRNVEPDTTVQTRRSRSPLADAGSTQRPMSVAERIMNMENFLEQEAIRSPSTPPASVTGAVPKRFSILRASRNKERFHTQPVTQEELQASARLQSFQCFKKLANEKTSVNGLHEAKPDETDNIVNPRHRSNSVEITKETFCINSSTVTCVAHPGSPSRKAMAQGNCSAEEQVTSRMESTEQEEIEEVRGVCKSNSVSSKTSMFAQLEEEMKRAAKEASSRRIPKGSNRGVARYRERKDETSSRFATQPVTQDEVEAIRQIQRKVSSSSSVQVIAADSEQSNEGKDEDDPSKLSLAERVRLFNEKILEERLPKTVEAVPPPVLRKRLSSRFKTQPVTTEEMETAVQKISPLAASLVKPPDPELLGNISARAAKEKMFNHSVQLLAKSNSASRLIRVNSKDSQADRPVDSEARPKGILKHTRDADSRRASLLDSEKETETESETEVRGILKTGTTGSGTQTPELESFRHLKSVLKKETSVDESHSETYEIVSATNEHLRSILKPESTEWTAEDTSSAESSSSSSENSDSERPSSNTRRSNLRGGSGIDLVSILHGVEAHARKQRQALVTPPNNKQKQADEEKLRNMKNLSQEKENKQLKDAYQKKRTDENHVTGIRKSIETQGNYHTKIVESKSLVNQRKLEAKQVVEELNQIKKSVVSTKVEVKDTSYEKKVRRQLEELQHLSSTETTTPPTSDGDTSSSGGREVRRIIRNEAVARRRQASINKQQRERAQATGQPIPSHLVKSQSHSSVPSCDGEPVRGGLRRSSTQPMSQELEVETMSGASIADRLAALQKSGSTEWRKRLSRLNPEDDLTLIATNNHLNELHSRAPQQQQDEDVGNGHSPSSILAERLGKLDAATHGWKKRVGPTDAVNFSVAGRMFLEQKTDVTLTALSDTSQLPAQLKPVANDRQKRTPRAARFRSKTANLKDVSSTPTSPQKDTLITFKRSISAPGGDQDNSFSGLAVDQDEVPVGPKVAVPRADDETFTQFFSSVTMEKCQNERLELHDADLDKIISSSSQLLVQKRTVKMQRRNFSSRNPIKALAARTDLQEEYVEVRTGLADRELKRLKVEQLAKNSPLAVEALAGLASKEDFTAVALKKHSPSMTSMLPYKDLMLLHIKGRRHVQTRLVEPVASSINSGDNYVLVTPTEVFNWVGRYSNVIERSRGSEVAQHIQQRKDLGCSGAGQVITISEEKVTCSSTHVERFWKLLGAGMAPTPMKAGHPDEDELFETSMIATNMVFEVQDHELVPIESWGNIPRINILDPAKILVFDFGSELYVWNGKNASLEARRSAQRLARELWDEGYDYSECNVCPLNIASSLGGRSYNENLPLKGSCRPSWALLAKVNQHMETILFREKFLDWPDFSRVIRTKSMEENEKQVDASIDVKPCDVKQMLESSPSEPDLELEGTHLGRGLHYYDEETHRHSEIKTLGVSVWHILEYEHAKLPDASVGQFHAGDSYVVRWQYSVTVTGRELGSGQPSRHSMLGRDRCAYFCWQGEAASLNEQGAAALLTVELDHERGPQVRAVQGAEPPAFLNLFRGCMVVHSGHREPDEEELEQQKLKGLWKLYMCRGETDGEAVLVQVACSVRQLRSRACLVLLNTATGAVYIWNGAKTTKNSCRIALKAAEHLKEKKPAEVGFKSGVNVIIFEEHEGTERREFFEGLGGDSRQLYLSLAKHPGTMIHTPCLFQLSSLSGVFCATEVFGAYRQCGNTMAYPFSQADLYGVSQPALFLLDNGDEVWLWQGWWPENGDDSILDSSNQTGSGAVRWQAERRAAMQTALDYWRVTHPTEKSSSLTAYLVWAGLEPLGFTNLFPMWTDRDDIAELNIRDGKKPGEVLTVEAELARLTRSTYPPAQLLQRPLPDGVDPTRLELYLDPHHFQELLGMSKEEFLELPMWKQTKVKKEVGLF